MGQQTQVNTTTTLEHVHGVHIIQHSPFELQELSQNGNFDQPTHGRLTIGITQLLRVHTVQRVWEQRPSCLRPIHGCMHGDRHLGERIANVVTSIPFIAVGIQAPRKNLNSKLYANSLIGVGITSSLYHSSKGRWRKYLRWADYTMIAAATVCLSRALSDENPKLLMAASALCLPIQPLMVSAVHTGMMEVAFARRAVKNPELKLVHNVHKMSVLLGGAFFVADDLFPEIPYLHAGWHLAAAIGVGACSKLLE
ncbi:uncharacterized protein LOC143561025 isoform X1 [Bidens hawaiensis]|uniref:uncharacterized protein LOC143561025 isoform X1 n=1 Tax=Bidens hawaiensis TaxID=980011 RepID=UPI00404959DE